MWAIAMREPGPPEVLELRERPTPQPGPREVLVAVHAAGVNRPDLLQRRGLYPPPPGITQTLGLELAGIVQEVGREVQRWQPGDRVCALVAGGAYAQQCVVPEGQCLPVPPGWTLQEAASVPETAFTVWSNVFDRGQLQPGQWFLVHGGTSGIGVMAIQMARALGAQVLATAGTAQKCQVCEQLGAVKGINYRLEDFVQVTKNVTQGHGVDVILDMVAGDYTPRNLEALADDGRLLVIATLGGSKATISLADLLRRRLTISGSTLRARPLDFKANIAAALEQNIWPLLEKRTIKPVIDRVFPLADAAQAHARMESGVHVGKLVLQVQEE